MGVPVGDMEQRLGVAEDVDGIEGGRMSAIVQEPIVLLIVHQRRERIVDGEPVKEGGRPRNGVQIILIQSRRRLKEGRGLEELIKGRRKQSFSLIAVVLLVSVRGVETLVEQLIAQITMRVHNENIVVVVLPPSLDLKKDILVGRSPSHTKEYIQRVHRYYIAPTHRHSKR